MAATADELGAQLARAHRTAPALLLLDGFERFLDDAGEVTRLLAAVASLRVLVTSRAALRLSGEHVYLVHPLAPPNAAALFIARAGTARADWTPGNGDPAIVDQICARLDGLPLAIELAAEDRLEHAAALARRGADQVEIIHALLWLGRSRARAGDAAGAVDALDAARVELGGAVVPVLVALMGALEA